MLKILPVALFLASVIAFQVTPASTASAEEAIVVEGLTGDPAAGEKVFRRCAACHALQEGANRVGPSLYGLIGRTAGTVEGYRYSKANAESGIVWTPEVMFEYLENPRKFIPGTKMAFPGLPNPQDRVDVISYIANNGGMAAQ